MNLQVDDELLVDAARRGDARCREHLVARYLPAVRALAMRYRGLGLSVDDLAQEGAVGLLEAIERYDPERGVGFATYARFRSRRAMRNALTDQSRLIRLPKHVVERRRAIDRAETRLHHATGSPPSPVDLAEATGLSATAVIVARGVGTTPVSLDRPVNEDGSTLGANLADDSAGDPEAMTVENEEIREVDDAVARLSDRQREIISRHYGIGRTPQELPVVAQELHVSQQRARTIERNALYALRDELEPRLT